MNYGELKENIRDLAFEEDDQMEEYESIVINAINRAITMIAEEVAPIRKYITIEQDGTDEEYQYYNMPTLTKNMFLGFDDTPVQVDDGDKFVRFGDYEIETGNTIVMSGDEVGTFKIYYKSAHEPYSALTDDTADLPLPRKAHHLVPLLAAYYVWIDDDQAKAVMYYNQFETASQILIADEQKPRMRVRTDWYNKNKGNNLGVSYAEWRRWY